MSAPASENPANQDLPNLVTPSPLNMPGAKAAVVNTPPQTVHAPQEMAVAKTETKAPEGDTVNVDELMAKYKGVQELARKFEKTAKEEHDDAERYRQLAKAISGNGDNPSDPMAAIQRLEQEIQSERTERVRERIARETGVPPTQVVGSDEESMKAAAEQALSWAKSLQQSPTGVPAAAHAELVNSSTPPHQTGVQQIQSRDELKGMSSKAIMEAYNAGRLDHLMGKQQQ